MTMPTTLQPPSNEPETGKLYRVRMHNHPTATLKVFFMDTEEILEIPPGSVVMHIKMDNEILSNGFHWMKVLYSGKIGYLHRKTEFELLEVKVSFPDIKAA